MINAKTRVGSEYGLNARAAAKLALRASRYRCSIQIEKIDSGRRIDAKSLMGVMMIAAGEGVALEVFAQGEDEGEALIEMCGLIESKGEPMPFL